MGFTEGPAFTLTRRLYANESGTIVTNEMVWCGSNPVTGSLCSTRRNVPPRFGVWGQAVSGTNRLYPLTRPAATTAPLPLRTSRRVMEGGSDGRSMSAPPPRPPSGPLSLCVCHPSPGGPCPYAAGALTGDGLGGAEGVC